ncbi:hypothetical protein OJF2_23630 [Aquisphaera giovannonii]|uniref:DUF202 domain-containing protein n=1 Tax=Aquisphaera giovannonii TaxID=406548 RepID=A0A5B9VZZ7_9BACT|nr:DUF202 domain-containing protein [Aquisphaera giovannonii]QEH33833.1 hypothetical protein OJF2_23630 [Aquisphaera giovannonii]
MDDPRVYLAAERTFLAWVRTSLSLMGFGFLIARFNLLLHEQIRPPSHQTGRIATISPWVGFAMIVFGVAVCVVALLRHRDYIRRLEQGIANPASSIATPVVVAAILALVGLAMAVTILTL